MFQVDNEIISGMYSAATTKSTKQRQYSYFGVFVLSIINIYTLTLKKIKTKTVGKRFSLVATWKKKRNYIYIYIHYTDIDIDR